MDTKFCAGPREGYFTDEIFVYDAMLYSCDVSIAVWLGLAIFILILRVFILALVWYSWYIQRQSQLKKIREGTGTAQSRIKRFPLVAFLSTIDTIFMILLVLLASLNVISARRGNSLVFFILWISAVCAIQFASLRKMVALGVRIFRFDLSDHTGPAAVDAAAGTSLAAFDRLLQVLGVLMVLLLVCSFGFALACVTVGSEGELSRASISCLAIEQLLFYFAITYQYSRCIGYVQRMKESRNLTNDEYRQSFNVAIQKMRYQQLVMLITAFVEVAFFLYFIVTLRLYWWFVCLALGLDCFIYFFMVISFLPFCSGKNRRRKHNNNAVTNAEGDTGYRGSSLATAYRSTKKMVTSAKTDSMVESYHNSTHNDGDMQQPQNTAMTARQQSSEESSMRMNNVEEHAVPDYSSSANDTQQHVQGDE